MLFRSADNSDGVFDWKEWEQTADGFKLRKKKSTVSPVAEAQNVAGSDEIQAFDEAQENGEAAGTESAEAEGTTVQTEYYTAADGIVEITTRNEAGAVHTGSYLSVSYTHLGGALLHGMDTLIEQKTGVSTLTVQDAMSAVVVGTGKYAEVITRMEE